jgi:hypothetical protein
MARNCDGSNPTGGAKISYPFAPGLNRCPFSVVQPHTWRLIDIWQDWIKYQFLPYAGDLGNQPAPLFTALKVIEAARQDLVNKKIPIPEGKNHVGEDRDSD